MYQMNKKNRKNQEGMVKRHPDGFGFFIPDDPEFPDVYIPRHSMTGVMTNDRVLIEVEPERGTGRFRGEIVKILSRGTKKIVGQFFPLEKGGGLIRDEGKGWGQDLKIDAGQTMNARKGELVAAEIVGYPEDSSEFRGRVVQVIGSHEDPLNDIERVVHGLNMPTEFSKGAAAEASRMKPEVEQKDMKGRQDLRKLNFITIDGATAKDFDDAIYTEQNRQGFRLWVAIADVSHYVRPGSAIDRDAYERGTSAYFPNFVIPMLPEILSNELCSLKPKVPRLALVAEIQFDFAGVPKESRFYEAVIESKSRVTYGEAQEIIDGGDPGKHKHVAKDILRAADLAKILMAKRFQEGSLDLEIPETQLLIDAGGNPIDVISSERLFAHRLIEEMMLAANVAVAKFLADQEIPAIYRIHEPPNPEAIALLERYLRTFGGRVQLGQGKLQKRLTKALQEFEGRPEAQVLNILALRSMSQAKYSANNVGHFGLGFEFYTHFTSPIRRYPDLIVHRLLKSRIMPKSAYKGMGEDELASAGTMLSACEQRAVKAERQIQSIKKARFMQKHVGEEFDGVISSVTKFGIFVLLRQFEIDGLVHMDNLGRERLEFDEENLRLVARRSGLSYNIGDSVKVRVASADIEEGKIDFELATLSESARPSRELQEEARDGERPSRKSKGRSRAEKGRARHERENREREAARETREARGESRSRPDQERDQKGRGRKSRGGSDERHARRDQERRQEEPRSSRSPRKGVETPRFERNRPQEDRDQRNRRDEVRKPEPRPARPEREEKTAPKGRFERFGLSKLFGRAKPAAPPAPDEADELDLDAMPVRDHSDDVRGGNAAFDPGRKLAEALRRRGLKPTVDLDAEERPGRIGFGSKSESRDRRKGGDRRRSGDRQDERQAQAGSPERGDGGKGRGKRSQKRNHPVRKDKSPSKGKRR